MVSASRAGGLVLVLLMWCYVDDVAAGRRGVADVITKLQEPGGGGAGGAAGVIVGDDSSALRSDRTEGERVGGMDLVARNLIKAETTGTGSNKTKVDSTNNSTRGVSPPSSPPPSKPKSSSTVPPANVTLSSAPSAQDASIGDEAFKSSASPHGGTCTSEHGPVIASLAASGGDGEDGDHEYTLTVENGGGKPQLEVTIKTSNGLRAESPKGSALKDGKLVLKKGEAVTILVIDNEAAKRGARINISWGEGDCYVELPAENVGDDVTHPSYLSSLLSAQGTFALVLGGTLVFVLILGVVGVWGCVSWRANARRHGGTEAKYQELEMTLPATVSKQDDGMSPSAEGWDEVWEDDDWQDMEAVRSSSASLTLSANGLNSRRANKEGWDSSWDD